MLWNKFKVAPKVKPHERDQLTPTDKAFIITPETQIVLVRRR